MVISNPEKRGFRINAFQRSCIQFDRQFFTLIRGRKYYCIRPPCTKTVHDRFFSVYRRMSPYTTRRYTILILSHVNRRISPYTAVHDRACSTWVMMIVLEKIFYYIFLLRAFICRVLYFFLGHIIKMVNYMSVTKNKISSSHIL